MNNNTHESQNHPYPGQQWQGQPGNYQPPKKKRRKWPWIVLGIILVILVIIVGGCAALIGATGKAVSDASSSMDETKSVQVEITTSSTGHVTYGSSGSMSTEDIGTTWNKTIDGVKPTDGFSANVVGDVQDPNASVSCKLIVDGETKTEQQGTGAGSTAACTMPIDF